jgi:hypothetical protein
MYLYQIFIYTEVYTYIYIGDMILVATDPTTARKLLLEGETYMYL